MRIFEADSLSAGDLELILSFLRAAGVIAFPTDTAYGLGADPYSEAAVRRIFEIKGRPEAKPILVLVDSLAMVSQIADCASIGNVVESLARSFWPGPLTIVLPALGNVPRLVTAATGSIGVRLPQADFARRLIRALGRPITATSANKSGQPSTASAAEVQAQLGQDLDLLVDGGVLTSPQASTVLDLTGKRPAILREGPVPRAALQEVLNGNIQ